jgi:SAM-dependent methyltransferase
MTRNPLKKQTAPPKMPVSASAQAASARMAAPLFCPDCGVPLDDGNERLACAACRKQWPVIDGVPTFTTEFPYWGEVPQEAMQRVNREARSKPWKTVLLESDDADVRRAAGMILNVDRANWHWLVDLPRDAQVVDIGAGTGANAEALARRFRKVYALEPVKERVEFMRHRFSQGGLDNVTVVRTSLWELPLPANSCQLIALNGVLEWVAKGREGDPRQLQLAALRNVARLLDAGGYVYIGIENRLPWQYFAGARDVHCGLPYVTILPRPLAHWYAKRHGQTDGYRNYLYSMWGYRKLLSEAGFEDAEFFLAIESYNWPRFYVPVKQNAFSYYHRNFNSRRSGNLARCANWLLESVGVLKHLQYSFAILAKKGRNTVEV